MNPYGVLNKLDEDSVDPCSWAMITCSPDNLVICLGAPSQSLSGTLSGAIGNLTNLRQVLLQNNNISGQIPPELGTLSKLQTLDLSNNRFSSVVPDSLGQLNSLQYLRLNNNSLSGPFPVSLGKISQLVFLDLSYNNLSGPVPKSPARTFNVAGNPLICGSSSTEGCSGSANVGPLSFSLGTSPSQPCISLPPSTWNPLAPTETQRPFDAQQHSWQTGGFGNVYKGKLGDRTMVAVKRLKDLTGTSGESQFRTELEMISLAVHRNLLRLIGYCATSNERLLVYPYMSNGSVASRLRGDPKGISSQPHCRLCGKRLQYVTFECMITELDFVFGSQSISGTTVIYIGLL
uniref:Protein kinase domain-containing protein n=1 Tax=Populus alba TaxID=43335 RepID=A0A4U5Q6H7_POPAL|nr:hypothetical protein D5086_0000128890 [Populus alba]